MTIGAPEGKGTRRELVWNQADGRGWVQPVLGWMAKQTGKWQTRDRVFGLFTFAVTWATSISVHRRKKCRNAIPASSLRGMGFLAFNSWPFMRRSGIIFAPLGAIQ